MSYEISYRRVAFRLTAEQAGHFDDVFFLVEEAGSNNCYEAGSRRRSRRWECLAAGAKWECLAEVTYCAAACCSGSLCLHGRLDTTPEMYIRAWRKALAGAVLLAEAPSHGFHLQLFTRISSVDAQDGRRRAFALLAEQTMVAGRRSPPGADIESWEWRFDSGMAAQVKLWLDTKANGRGYHGVETYGPRA